jgi:1,4-alpha-glucan branching enzyme
LERHRPAPGFPDLGVTTWGEGGDLRTWSGPRVADLAWRARLAELRLAAAPARPPDRALRELLAVQSSDWAFLRTRESAGDYPLRRADSHHAALERALAGQEEVGDPALRGLAPDLRGWA